MQINKTKKEDEMILELEGRLDTMTAPELEKVINSELSGVRKLTMDLAKLEYISSAGLRVLLSAQKIMSKQGSMVVLHANELIMEVFEVTGFTDILNIQ